MRAFGGRTKGRAGQAGRRQGAGRVQAGCRQGAGRVQAGCRQGAGHRARGRVGLQDSILRFSRPENPEITVLQLFEERGPPHTSEFKGYGLRSYRLIRRSPVLGV